MGIEFDKWRRGEPFDSAKLWAEMDDDFLDLILDAVPAPSAEPSRESKPLPGGPPPAVKPNSAEPRP
jgi:hypothetical protein